MDSPDLDFHLINGSLCPHELAPNRISIGSIVFAEHIRVTNTQTDRQTERPRYA